LTVLAARHKAVPAGGGASFANKGQAVPGRLVVALTAVVRDGRPGERRRVGFAAPR
jgi:hypothetical protein